MLKLVLPALVLYGLSAYAEAELPLKDFLYRVRHPAGRKRWALMDGEVIHRRRGKETVKASLRLGILFNTDRTLAQVLIDRRQGYMVGQAFSKGSDGTSIIPLNKESEENPVIGNFGLRPQDLAMTFLYWKFDREFPGESTKMVNCRVLRLISPDDKEYAKVWISREYYFPIKAEWTRINEKEPFRSLEVSSFKQQGNYGIIKCLELYGPGWRTRINFTETEVGTPEKGGIPKDLFLKIPQ
ncbi:MAG: hypothetical protein PHV82_08590 [Victivallaceae bacterium]|nr:hypothetical protein [Victivallaceae bacterium]